MKKLVFVFFVAFIATMQVSYAQYPVLNVDISGPETTALYDIYIQVVDNNNNRIAGPSCIKPSHCFGVEGSFVLIDYTYTQFVIPNVNPSPKEYCKIQVGVVAAGTTTPNLAPGASEFMSYDEITTSAKPVKSRF
jgi:hypothetical protein